MEAQQYIVGLDLGQAQDYTAIAIVQRVPVGEPPQPVPAVRYHADGSWTYSVGEIVVGGRRPGLLGVEPALHDLFRRRMATPPPQQMVPGPDRRPVVYHIRHLERPPRGTQYPAVVTRVRKLLATPPLSRGTPLVIDKTGVGMAVVDLFVAAGVRPHAITITGGDEVIRDGIYHTKVPKRELVGNLVAVFQTGRLQIAAGLVEEETLVEELANFKVKVNVATGHDRYEGWREGIHDDLVLAVALAVWHGERMPPSL
jgi:hypothetical protein